MVLEHHDARGKRRDDGNCLCLRYESSPIERCSFRSYKVSDLGVLCVVAYNSEPPN